MRRMAIPRGPRLGPGPMRGGLPPPARGQQNNSWNNEPRRQSRRHQILESGVPCGGHGRRPRHFSSQEEAVDWLDQHGYLRDGVIPNRIPMERPETPQNFSSQDEAVDWLYQNGYLQGGVTFGNGARMPQHFSSQEEAVEWLDRNGSPQGGVTPSHIPREPRRRHHSAYHWWKGRQPLNWLPISRLRSWCNELLQVTRPRQFYQELKAKLADANLDWPMDLEYSRVWTHPNNLPEEFYWITYDHVDSWRNPRSN